MIDEATQKQLGEMEQLKKDYLSTFSTEAGKKVLKHLQGICYTNKSTFPKDGNGLTLAFHEGMRYVIVHVKNMMNFNLETLKKLVATNSKEE